MNTTALVPTHITTHSGPYHADDVFSIALLTLINPHIEVKRTRDEELIKQAEMRVDVGGKYNPKTMDFDHHLEEQDIPRHPNFLWNKEERNGPKKSSIGLIWEVYGKAAIEAVVSSESKNMYKHELTELQLDSVFETIKKTVIVPIDIEDNGEWRTYFGPPASPYRPLSINAIIRSLVPQIREEFLRQSEELISVSFKEAVIIARKVIKGHILKQYYSVKDVEFIKQLLMDHDGTSIFVVPKICSWQHALIVLERTRMPELVDHIRSLFFVVFPVPSSEGGRYNWMVQPTKMWNNQERMFTMKLPLAENLRGKKLEELQSITGIATLTFVHPSGFIGGAMDKEDAIKLAKYTIDQARGK